ncbi:MAG: LD-carboxypeptidase [Proteobacteria bacterium]|nr:MAG: LD-carboxypeptidase [Pseudomonadota bacterium]
MKFPKPLSTLSKIAITAPSSGVAFRLHQRLDSAIGTLRAHGFDVEEGQCLRTNVKHVSASREDRAHELMKLWSEESISMIFPPWGGELLIEILPLLDFELFARSPKWIQGFSDLSTLLLPITIISDVATSHGSNLMDYQSSQSDPFTLESLRYLSTELTGSFEQHSSKSFQKDWPDFGNDPGAAFNLTETTEWKRLGKIQSPVTFHGRLLGGCLDTLHCLVGTKYGDVPTFAKRYQNDKLIVYLENCDQKPADLARALWNFRLAGWFDNCSGILLGRSSGPDYDNSDFLSYGEAVESVLGDLGLPVIFDADIGHVPPQMTLINGALAEVKYSKNSSSITQTFKS